MFLHGPSEGNYLPWMMMWRGVTLGWSGWASNPLHTPLFHNTQGVTHGLQLPCSVCYTWTMEYVRLRVPPINSVLWQHTNSTVGLLALSQLRQLVLFNMKYSPIRTLAGILKNTSLKNSDLSSHCQSQLLSAKQHCMCSWHNFINNLGKQRILQQIAVAFWLYCATDNNCLKLSVFAHA